MPDGVATDQFLLGDRVMVAPVLDKGAACGFPPAGGQTD
jgi:hypothetical protein